MFHNDSNPAQPTTRHEHPTIFSYHLLEYLVELHWRPPALNGIVLGDSVAIRSYLIEALSVNITLQSLGTQGIKVDVIASAGHRTTEAIIHMGGGNEKRARWIGINEAGINKADYFVHQEVEGNYVHAYVNFGTNSVVKYIVIVTILPSSSYTVSGSDLGYTALQSYQKAPMLNF